MARDVQAERHDRKVAREEARRSETRGRRRASGEPMRLTLLQWLELVALTDTVTEQGGAVRVGFTRDGGALALGMYMDDDSATEYIRPSEDFEEALASIAAAWAKDGAVRYAAALDNISDSLQNWSTGQAQTVRRDR